MCNFYVQIHARAPSQHHRPSPPPRIMDKFNNIIVAAEQFSVQKYLRDVEEAFSLKQYSSDIFAAFRRQALLKIAPALLRDVSGISSLQLPGAPKNLLLQNDTNEQISEEGGVNVRHREPNEFGYEFGNVLKSNWYRKFLHNIIFNVIY